MALVRFGPGVKLTKMLIQKFAMEDMRVRTTYGKEGHFPFGLWMISMQEPARSSSNRLCNLMRAMVRAFLSLTLHDFTFNYRRPPNPLMSWHTAN
jgi:hypothetical protein